MLINFKFKNFKSFKNFQEFTMVAGPTKLNEDTLFEYKNSHILKFSAFYGANGSGKSNTLKAIEYMKDLVLGPYINNMMPFYYKLDKKCAEEPTYFEVTLLLNGHLYSYGFVYSSKYNKFMGEWLDCSDNKKDKEIFTRDFISDNHYYNDSYFGSIKNRIQIYSEDAANSNTLLLSYLGRNAKQTLEKLPVLNEVYNWFNNSLVINESDILITSGGYFLTSEKIDKFQELLEYFGTGVKGIGKQYFPEEFARAFIPNSLYEKIKENVNEHRSEEKYSSLWRIKNDIWEVVYEDEKFSFNKICFYHDEGKEIPFDMSDESEGTVRLMDLAEILLTDQENRVFIVDELDRKLHPVLTRRFIEKYKEKNKNTKNQLIVTTQDVSLMELTVLRRDEIWFAEKNKDGDSRIFSLEDFKIRFDKKILNDYLDGRYGAIPHFKGENILIELIENQISK